MFNKQTALNRQFFTSEEIDASQTSLHQGMTIEGGVITAEKGLVIDGHLKNCHISTTDKSAIFISAMATLEDCVVQSPDLLIDGKFKGTIVVEGKDGEDVGGRLEYGSGAQIFGVAYVSENIVQTKGVKVVMDVQQRPFNKYVAKTTKAVASPDPDLNPVTSVAQFSARQS